MVSEIEPLGIKQAELPVPVSLRGSLAGRYFDLISNDGRQAAANFIRSLLFSRSSDLLKYREGNQIVIGLCSEKGMFFPDW